MFTYITPLSSAIIPSSSDLSRTPPRPPEEQDANYAKLFDFKTLFYDVFLDSNGNIILSGPPMLNLYGHIRIHSFKIDGNTVPTDCINIKDIRFTQHSYINMQRFGKILSFDLKDIIFSLPIQKCNCDIFNNKKVIFTISKNNDLHWIKDWAEFYVKVHNANAVLLYDNASSIYNPGNIVNALKTVNGIDVAVVVPWNFPYGHSRPGKQDSVFLQTSLLEHARRRFLYTSKGSINVDIDELVLTKNSETIFDLLEKEGNGKLHFRGHWIDTIGYQNSILPRHRCFCYIDKERKPTMSKWAADFSKLSDDTSLRVHSIHDGKPVELHQEVILRHFECMSNNWKRKRLRKKEYNPERHIADVDLLRCMEKIGWI